jgi:D-lactate dehydrogenase (cytochrome)
MSRLRAALVAAVSGDPSRVSTGRSDLDLHAGDSSFHRPVRPDVVVSPSSTDEVSAVLEVAAAHAVPVTPFGAGSSLEGQVIPLAGGISLDLVRLDRVVDVAPSDLTAVVQAGVRRSALDAAAGELGLFFPVDPGADATLGGMAATNAAGTTTLRYGKMRDNVLALEAVLPGGAVIRTGSRAPKTSAGYDLTGLLVGSEGTLAVITELTLRLHGIPEHAGALRASLPTADAACRVASAVVGAGLGVTRLELLDSEAVDAVNAHLGAGLPAGACLLVESVGAEQAVAGDLELVGELVAAEGATDVVVVGDPTSRSRLWRIRHDVTQAMAAAAPGRREWSTDTCVPIAELPGAVAFARAELERRGLHAPIVGHVGDGNVHVALWVDPDDAGELDRAAQLVDALVDDALARGGTCSGEHGIGLGKIGALEREHADLVPLYRGVKELFDPSGIMNPGKVLAS